MVRGAAALLIAGAWLVLAPALPGEPDGEASRALAALVGGLAVGAWALALVPARDEMVGVAFVAVGALLLAGALRVAEAGTAAGPVEALAAGAAGLLFARALAAGPVAVAVPLFVGAIDLVSALSGPAADPGVAPGQEVDLLTVALPAWGGEAVARLTALDVGFLAAFAAWAWRYDLRPRAASAAMVAGLALAPALGIVADRAIPSLPLVAAAYLLAGVGRLGRTARTETG